MGTQRRGPMSAAVAASLSRPFRSAPHDCGNPRTRRLTRPSTAKQSPPALSRKELPAHLPWSRSASGCNLLSHQFPNNLRPGQLPCCALFRQPVARGRQQPLRACQQGPGAPLVLCAFFFLFAGPVLLRLRRVLFQLLKWVTVADVACRITARTLSDWLKFRRRWFAPLQLSHAVYCLTCSR